MCTDYFFWWVQIAEVQNEWGKMSQDFLKQFNNIQLVKEKKDKLDQNIRTSRVFA